jgi:hypothetical protein
MSILETINNLAKIKPRLFTVCNGDQYDQPSFLFIQITPPKTSGWYPILLKGMQDGEVLSFWDGMHWCKPTPASATAKKAGVNARRKTNEKFSWFAPWWTNGAKTTSSVR